MRTRKGFQTPLGNGTHLACLGARAAVPTEKASHQVEMFFHVAASASIVSMNEHFRTVVFVVLGGLFASAHLIAIQFHLYWYYWWFDLFMHTSGGALVVFGLVALRELPVFRSLYPDTPLFLFLVLTALMIAWEIFEFVQGVVRAENPFYDTAGDILFGYLGGALAYFCLRLRVTKRLDAAGIRKTADLPNL
jgi:hypothetical protein